MSQTIDNRVVALDFENYDFEKNANQSLKTIDKLKSSLNFTSAAKNLTALSNASSKFNLSGISRAVDQVGEKFSYLKYSGLVALSNLVTGAMQAGKRFASALIGPITTGGWNRAMNLEQANFMMKGLLKTDEAVKAVMADVNESVDGTAYSLDAAAKVAAQFAASGLKAGETMLPALKAVAGTAAMTNSSFEEIGQIFTTVAGQGKLMTYQMRQLEFRGLNVAATLGEQLGKSEAEIRDMVTKGKISFEMFSNAMNSAFGEHAQEANNTFQGAMSNVRSALGRIGAEFATPFIHSAIPALNSFRLAINEVKKTMGPVFTEAASIMEKISNLIVSRVDGFTNLLKKRSENFKGIFKDILGSLKNVFNFVMELIQPIRDMFEMMFPPKTIAYVKQITVAILQFTRGLKVSESTTTALRLAFAGLFSIFDTAKYIIVNLAQAMQPLVPIFRMVGNALLILSAYIGDALLRFNTFIKTSDEVRKVFDKIYNITSVAAVKIRDVLAHLFDGVSIEDGGFIGIIAKIIDYVKNAVSKLSIFIKDTVIPTLKQAFGSFPDIFHNLLGIINNILSGSMNAIKNFLHSQDFKDFAGLVAKGGLLYTIINFAKGFGKGTGGASIFGNLFNFNFSLFGSIGKGLSQIGLAIKENVNVELIHEVGVALLELAAALAILSGIDQEGLDKAVNAILTLMTGMGIFVGVIMKMTEQLGGIANTVTNTLNNIKGQIVNSFTGLIDGFKDLTTAGALAAKIGAISLLIEQLAKSILILAIATKIFSSIDMAGIAKGVFAISIMMAELAVASRYIAESNMEKSAKSIYKGLTKMASAMLIISFAMKVISTIDTEGVVNSVFALGIIFGEMALLSEMVGKAKGLKKAATGMLIISTSFIIIAQALRYLAADIDPGAIATSAMSLSAVFIVLAYFLKSFENAELVGRKLYKTAAAFSVMGSAVLIISQALAGLSGVSLGTIGASVIAFGVLLEVMAQILNKLADINAFSLLGIAGSLTIVAAGLSLLAGAIYVMGQSHLDPVMIGTVVAMMAAITVPLASLVYLLEKDNRILHRLNPASVIALAGAIAIVAAALDVMAVSIFLLSKIPSEKMADTLMLFSGGVIMMVSSLLILAGACATFKKVKIKNIIGASKALAIVGLAMIELSAALWIISKADVEGLGSTFVPFALLLGELFVGLTYLAEKCDGGKLILAAGVMVATAQAFLGLAAGIALMSLLDKDKIITSASLLAGIIAELNISLVALSNEKIIKNPSRMIVAAGCLTVLASAMYIISAALAQLAKPTIFGKKLNQSAVILSTMFGILSTVLVAITAFSKGSSFNIASVGVAAGALVAVSGSLMIISAAIGALAKLKNEDMQRAAVALGAMYATLGTILIILALIGSTQVGAIGLGIAAAAILAISVALLAMSASFLNVATGIERITNSIHLLADGLNELSKIDTSSLEKFARSMFTLLKEFGGFILRASWLSLFSGPALAVFATSLSMIGVGFSAVAKGLIHLNVALRDFVDLSFKAAKSEEDFIRGAQLMGSAVVIMFASMGTGLAVGITNFLQALSEKIQEIVGYIYSITSTLAPVAVNVVLIIINSVIESIAVYGPKIIENMVSILTVLLRVLADHSKEIADALADLWDGLAASLEEKMPELTDRAARLMIVFLDNMANKVVEYQPEFERAFTKLFFAVIESNRKWSEHFKELGKFLLEGLKEGILDATIVDDVLKAAGSVANRVLNKFEEVFEINSPSRRTHRDGENIDLGFVGGMESKAYLVENTAKQLGLSTVSMFDAGLEEGTPTIESYLDRLLDRAENSGASIDRITSWIATRTKERFADVSGSFTDLTSKVEEGTISWEQYSAEVTPVIDKIHEIHVQQDQATKSFQNGGMDLQTYQAVMSSTGSQLDILIGKVKELKEALGFLRAQQATNLKAYNDNEAAYRNGNKTYGDYRATLERINKSQMAVNKSIEELGGTVWETKEKTKEGTEANNEYATSLGGTGKAAKSAKNDVEELHDSLVKTLESQLNLFDEYKKEDPMNPDQILKNMTDQINGMVSWAANMDKIAAMGIDQGLYQKLAEMGPQGAKYVSAFASMTAEQLQQANQLFATSLALPETVASGLVNNMNLFGQNTTAGFVNGMTAGLETVGAATTELSQTVVDNTQNGPLVFGSPSETMIQYGRWIDEGLRLGIRSYQGEVFGALEFICTRLVGLAKIWLAPGKWAEIGKQIPAGLKAGVESGQGEFWDTVANMAREAAQKARDALVVESPSKVFAEIGRYTDLGFAKGITDNANVVYHSVEDMADNAVNTMKMTIANISAQINDSFEDPVITPVLDLSNIQRGARFLQSTFSTNQALSAQAGFANLQNGNLNGSGNVVFNQYNTSPKALSRIDIYRDTRNLFAQAKGALS